MGRFVTEFGISGQSCLNDSRPAKQELGQTETQDAIDAINQNKVQGGTGTERQSREVERGKSSDELVAEDLQETEAALCSGAQMTLLPLHPAVSCIETRCAAAPAGDCEQTRCRPTEHNSGARTVPATQEKKVECESVRGKKRHKSGRKSRWVPDGIWYAAQKAERRAVREAARRSDPRPSRKRVEPTPASRSGGRLQDAAEGASSASPTPAFVSLPLWRWPSSEARESVSAELDRPGTS